MAKMDWGSVGEQTAKRETQRVEYARPGTGAAAPGSVRKASSLSESQVINKQAKAPHPASIDPFSCIRSGRDIIEIGRPFRIDYASMHVMTADVNKMKAGGISPGTFLVAVSPDVHDPEELILLRVLRPSGLPTDTDMVSTMIASYKDDKIVLDGYTRHQMQFSGLECRVLGSFYQVDGETNFAGDVDNIYTPSNYVVVKPQGQLLETLINYRPKDANRSGDVRVGRVRYADSEKHRASSTESDVEESKVFLSALDFLGKRTAAFGMTRTGKSNTIKVLIEAIQKLPDRGATIEIDGKQVPVEPVGQLIFDINGEYANTNVQDGTSIYEKYADITDRYAVQEKPGFTVMKFNFFDHIPEGFALMRGRSGIKPSDASYWGSFYSIEWEDPSEAAAAAGMPVDRSAKVRYDRQVAAYRAVLHAAGFESDAGRTVSFEIDEELRLCGVAAFNVDTKAGLTLDEARRFFEAVWAHHKDPDDPERTSAAWRAFNYFDSYPAKNNGKEWADETLRSILTILCRTKAPGGVPGINGYLNLRINRDLHTRVPGESFEVKIVRQLRQGHIVILDLAQGDPLIQTTYSERIASAVFSDAQSLFVQGKKSNFIQMWFEEAQNLFTSDDLTNIYLRLAKEGAKYALGMGYSTQEVTSVPSNIRANTQNWFTSHLNNETELRALSGYYDYEDFIGSLRRTSRKGFIRMKTDSSSYIIPVQMDKFGVGVDR